MFELVQTGGLAPHVVYVAMTLAAWAAAMVLSSNRPWAVAVRTRAFVPAASCVACAVVAALYMLVAPGIPTAAVGVLLLAVALCFAGAFAVLLLGWVDAFAATARGDVRAALFMLAAAVVVSLIVALLSYAIAGDTPVLVASAVFGSGVLLFVYRAALPAQTLEADRGPALEGGFEERQGVALLTGIIVAFFMTALSISGSISSASLGLDVGENPYLRHLVTIAEILLVSLFALLTDNARKLVYVMWVVLSMLFVGGLLMMRADNQTIMSLGVALSTAGRSCFELLLLLVLMWRPGGFPSPRLVTMLFLLPETLSILFGRLLLPLYYAAMGLSPEEYMGVLTVALPIVLVAIVVAALACELFRAYDESAALALEVLDVPAGLRGEEDAASEVLLVDRYGLTQKESQIACLLAKGYSAARIAEMKTLSINTVRTHAKNVYRKMDVHSRQELIDALEAEV